MQVNRIKELPQNSKIIATHTDSPDVRKLVFLITSSKVHFWYLFYLIFFWRFLSGTLNLSPIAILCWELMNPVQIWLVNCQKTIMSWTHMDIHLNNKVTYCRYWQDMNRMQNLHWLCVLLNLLCFLEVLTRPFK